MPAYELRISDWSSDVCSADLRVGDAVVEAARLGVPGATILADGFAEMGEEGRARQERLVARAAEGGMRLLGPNSMGVINVVDKVPFTTNAALEAGALLPGRLMALSQSGSLIGTLLSRGAARGIGFAHLVRSEEHTSELQSLMRISYAVFCLK